MQGHVQGQARVAGVESMLMDAYHVSWCALDNDNAV